MSRKEKGSNRRSHTTREKPAKNHPRILHTWKSPLSIFSRPKGSHRNTIKGLTQAITRARKGKGPKCTTHFQCLIQSCSPYWFRIMRFLSFLQGLRDLYIQKSTMLMLNVNTMEELGGIPWRIARLSKTRFNRWSTQIQPNSEDLSTVTRSIKIKDQLGAILLWMFSFVNVFFEKCKLRFNVNICMKWIDFLDAFCHHEFCRCI